MPRGVYSRKPRARYRDPKAPTRTEQVRQVLVSQPEEVLRNLDACYQAVEEKGLKPDRRLVGIVRNKILRNGSGQVVLTDDAVAAVRKAAAAVGGFNQLKAAVAAIDRVRGM